MQNELVAVDVAYQLPSLAIKGLAYGNNQLPPLLCLHGWLDNAASFTPLMPHLIDRRIIAIDLAGHGLSGHRSLDAHYHFVDYIYDLVQLYELNKWPAIDIVAHSMGGMIASAFAAAFPEKVKSLTLIDSIGFLHAEAGKTTKSLRQGMLSRLANTTKQKSFHSTLDSAINARINVSDLKYPQAKLLVERGVEKFTQGYLWRSDARLRTKSPLRLSLEQSEQLIIDIKAPTQIIHGDKGFDMVKSAIEHYRDIFSALKITTLTGGHHVHMEQPKETAKLIQQFI